MNLPIFMRGSRDLNEKEFMYFSFTPAVISLALLDLRTQGFLRVHSVPNYDVSQGESQSEVSDTT